MRKSLVLMLVAVSAVASLGAPTNAKEKKKRPPVTFEAEGSILAPQPADLAGHGITRAQFEADCAVPTVAQGLDGYVIEVPPKSTAVNSNVLVESTSASSLGLIDLFFFSETCYEISYWLGSDEAPPLMPMGTKFVLVTNWFGDSVDFTFQAVEAR